MQLDDVLVVQDVVPLDGLPVEHAGASDAGALEAIHEIPMHLARQVQHRPAVWDREG